MPRLVPVLVALAAVLPGCYENHTGVTALPEGGFLLPDGAIVSTLDGGPAARDVGPDVLGSYWNDASPVGRRDVGVHPRLDAGPPPGDGLGDHWDGYIEAYAFESGSDHITIRFDTLVPGEPASGYVVLGEGPAPAPATDPNVGWPVSDPTGGIPTGLVAFGVVVEGYAYRFDGADLSADRARITLDLGEPWRPWCELQYPVPSTGPTTYDCLPNVMGRQDGNTCSQYFPATDEWLVVDCVRALLCASTTGACACDAASCTSHRSPALTIDFHIVGDAATGTLVDVSRGDPSGHAAHLTRMP